MRTGRILSLAHWMLLLVGTVSSAGCGSVDPSANASVDGESDANGESVTSVAQAAVGPTCAIVCKPTSSCSQACIGSKTCGAYGVCATADPDGDGVPTATDNCRSVYNPNQANCDGDALGDACETDLGRYVRVDPTLAICHIDIDTHIDGVDVELYTVDLYRDTSCLALPNAYYKRQVSSVHCGFHSEATCQNRVTERLVELSAYGYFPAVSVPDSDQCPYPRISSGSIAPPPASPPPPRPPIGEIP